MKNIGATQAQRLVVYVSGSMRSEIEHLTKKEQTTMANFCRTAITDYLQLLKANQRRRELRKVCQEYRELRGGAAAGWIR